MTLQDSWRDYREKMYPQGIPADQNRETHQAFMAGALVAFMAMNAAGRCEDTPQAELAAAELLDELSKEAQEWARQLVTDMQRRQAQGN